MAKKSKTIENVVNREMLAQIASGFVSFVNQSEALEAGLNLNPPLIEVNMGAPNSQDASRVAVRITEAGAAYLTQNTNPVNEASNSVETTPLFEIMDGVVIPPKRRFSNTAGAPKIYPFDKLEVGQTFFVPVSAKHPDPVKTLGSTVSSANLRFAEQTGTKSVTRAKRGKGNKLELDAQGQKIMETKEVPVYKFTRRFEIRPIEAGKEYGTLKATANGELIVRVE